MMKREFVICALIVRTACFAAAAEPPAPPAVKVVDLPSVLELAGARNLDVQLAREKVAAAEAAETAARQAFFPWIEPGIAYRHHGGLIQNTEGDLVDVDKQVFAGGITIAAQTRLGDALFQQKEARQMVTAADHASDARRAEVIAAAAQAYFELARASGQHDVSAEALRIARDYESEVRHAVAAGLAFQGDLLRVKVQAANAQRMLRASEAEVRIAGARLAQVLNLDPVNELAPRDATLAPLALAPTVADVSALVTQAQESRPEILESRAFLEAAKTARRAATVAPLIPSLRGEGFFGGLNGGRDSTTNGFGRSEDYLVGVSWRIGPGGLFDRARLRGTQSGLRTAQISLEKVRAKIAREVVDASESVASLGDQMSSAREALESAQAAWSLIEKRKAFGVGQVLEAVQAQQDLAKARNDYLMIVADYDKAQYELLRALGAIDRGGTGR